MEKRIIVKGKLIKYRINKSLWAKNMRISVSCDAGVVLTLPRSISEKIAEEFLLQKIGWVLKKIRYFKDFEKIKYSKKDYLKNKETARKMIEEKILSFNKIYDFRFKRIAIRNQKTRWGSCSKDGNLNFNYKIIHLPEELQNYIIIHELCHLEEFNHSKKFWKLVERFFPDYKRARRNLRKIIL
ncbi:MAG: M48 family metallopeptidase [Candidatus Moranbacteria bacterium]|jgi:predicted metal-dependent hydrolase|nr:M48 family metallopeptidase [Candidatus Moranbacteria bacterium]MDD5652167.1 M48 family metallopeptidase [Candidatus Moranbacteria bacterium]MDX9855265.1 M48 family metallopeptidase [Candidatus Moranbacteria bacterium]